MRLCDLSWGCDFNDVSGKKFKKMMPLILGSVFGVSGVFGVLKFEKFQIFFWGAVFLVFRVFSVFWT